LEGCLVHNPAASAIDYPFYVSESSALEEYAAGPEQSEWTEDEIAAIRRVLFKLTALRILNPTDAEDLVQDTLLTMLTKYPGSELEKGLLVWSMGILRKKVGNYYKRAQRLATIDAEEAFARKIAKYGPGPAAQESRIHHHELRTIVDMLLGTFPTQERRALELLLIGLPTQEIARELSPERYQNIANRLHRGRKKLARELARYGYGPADRAQSRTGRRRLLKAGGRRK
jgi:RNA polymerase sigma factor (sigma-70 family)